MMPALTLRFNDAQTARKFARALRRQNDRDVAAKAITRRANDVNLKYDPQNAERVHRMIRQTMLVTTIMPVTQF